MCYLVAKDINKRGCVAFKTRLEPDLVSLKKELISKIGFLKKYLLKKISIR